MGVINIGRVRMGWKGAWDNTTPYISQDAVFHQGDTYVARIDVPAGTAPPNTTFWQLVAKKGEDGIDGNDGAQGPEGPEGLQGELGPIGPVGPQGDTGSAGTDATVNATNIAAAGGVLSDPTSVTGADAVANIMSLTQAEYNAIATPNVATIYAITDA